MDMMLKGIAVSDGIAVGKVQKFSGGSLHIVARDCEPFVERERLLKGLEDVKKELHNLQNINKDRLSEAELKIFDAHLSMLEDPEFLKEMNAEIDKRHAAEMAVKKTADAWISLFASTKKPFLIERIDDIKDVSSLLIKSLMGGQGDDLGELNHDVILVADNLTPSDTARMNHHILGIITEHGGRTSHVAIMAKALGIPAMVAVNGALKALSDDELVILNADKGEILVRPKKEELLLYEHLSISRNKEKEALKRFKGQKTLTLDSRVLELACNVGSPGDVLLAKENDAEALGLYRTEFLFLENRDALPSEEAQFKAYRLALEQMKGKRVVVRTLDIGGDKKLQYLPTIPEDNPFLGHRAIRLCLANEDIFKVQIRALLKASIYGKLAIMFPMIATQEEFMAAKSLVINEKSELLKAGIPVSDDIEIGMMIEVPSAAIMAEELAQISDFFSIGTNDLIQYTMAADRTLDEVGYLYQPLNPAILRLIKMTVDGAHKAGKWVGICGEMAADEKAAILLLGLGLDEFSVNPKAVLPLRRLLCSLNYESCHDLALKALRMQNEKEVLELLKSYIDSGIINRHL